MRHATRGVNARSFRRSLQVVTLSAFVGAGGIMPAASDILDVCVSEIDQFCSDVALGQGRISACLYAYAPRIAEPCSGEVAKIASSRNVQLFVPSGITDLKGTSYEAELRAACSADANRVCPGVDQSTDGVLACLYARERNLSASCRKTGDRVLRQIQ